MTINPSGYRATCDHDRKPGQHLGPCPSMLYASSLFGGDGLYRLLDREGWQRSVKLDGSPAMRGGREYCPKHRVQPPVTP